MDLLNKNPLSFYGKALFPGKSPLLGGVSGRGLSLGTRKILVRRGPTSPGPSIGGERFCKKGAFYDFTCHKIRGRTFVFHQDASIETLDLSIEPLDLSIEM